MTLGPSLAAAQKPKLPRPRILEHEIPLSRDPSTGELRAYPSGESESGLPSSAPVIRSRVALVEVQCTVTAPDGTLVRGLTRDDFRLWEDGTEQQQQEGGDGIYAEGPAKGRRGDPEARRFDQQTEKPRN